MSSVTHRSSVVQKHLVLDLPKLQYPDVSNSNETKRRSTFVKPTLAQCNIKTKCGNQDQTVIPGIRSKMQDQDGLGLDWASPTTQQKNFV